MSPPVTGILLAAGSSTRFGTDKLLHPLPDGTPMGLVAARKLVRVLPGALAVVRDADSELARLLAMAGLDLVVNEQASNGMGTSIACAVARRRSSNGWLVALADMPWVQEDSITRVVEAIEKGACLVAPAYRNRRGHPVGFSRRYQADLVALNGDRGARELLCRDAAMLELIAVEDPGVIRDVDEVGDVTAFPGRLMNINEKSW